MTEDMLLQLIKERLHELYGGRFRGLILFGSVARGDAGEDSDIDLLCLLDGPVNTLKEIRPIIDATSEIRHRYHARPVSITAVALDEYERGAYPLVIEAKREGLKV